MKRKSIKKNITNIKFSLLLFSVVTLLAVATSVSAQTVRGRLNRQGPAGLSPAPYVKVTLYAPNIGRSSPIYTGIDGMYYFYNVPPGDYILEIWGYGDRPITYSIRVPNELYIDISPIVIP